jgi:hypothetical protein
MDIQVRSLKKSPDGLLDGQGIFSVYKERMGMESSFHGWFQKESK